MTPLARVGWTWLAIAAFSALGGDIIASLYAEPAQFAAGKAWDNVIMHAEAMAALGMVIALLPVSRAAAPLIAIIFWRLLERGESAVCRLAFPMDRPPPPTRLFQGLCDIATGLPIYWLSMAAPVLLLVWLRRRT